MTFIRVNGNGVSGDEPKMTTLIQYIAHCFKNIQDLFKHFYIDNMSSFR